MRMASATCLSTTRAISVLDVSHVLRFPLIRTTPEPGDGAERSSNAAFTLFRREPADELLSRIAHSCRRWSDRYWRRPLHCFGPRLVCWVDGRFSAVHGSRFRG